MTIVAAVVVTYNAPETLCRCLAALREQTRKPDLVIVVDNASTPPAAPDLTGLDISVLRSEMNGGPAGGFANGLERFLETEARYAWVMDDDCEPDPQTLAMLIADADESTIVVPAQVSATGTRNRPAWGAVLIPRRVVETVGVPRRDFVWWCEDTEYLQWRIPRSGFATHNSRAVVRSKQPRRAGRKPLWKYYYEARNATYVRIYNKKHTRVKRLYRLLVRKPLVILASDERRFRALWWHNRGVIDGLFGRLGIRVALDDAPSLVRASRPASDVAGARDDCATS